MDSVTLIQTCWHTFVSGVCIVASNAVVQAVVGGVIVFVIGEVIQSLYVLPLTKYNDLRSEACYCLVHYANAYMNPCGRGESLSEWHKEAGNELRKLSSKMEAFAQENKFFATGAIPSKQNLQEVASWIRRISNNLSSNDGDRTITTNRRDQNAIKLYLSLDVEDYTGLDSMVRDKHFQRIAKKKMKK